MKKLIALVLALAMVFTIGLAFAEGAGGDGGEGGETTPAAAATIEISRHDSYAGDAQNASIRTLKYFKVFDATKGDGTAISYTLPATSPWVSVLTSDVDPQTYFNLSISGDGSLYYVTAGTITENNAQQAAQWLKDRKPIGVTETALTYSESTHKWTASVNDIGYYVIVSYDNNGDALPQSSKLIAWTTNIQIEEKNTYPTIKKEQKDSASGDYGHGNVKVKVGDTIYYSVEVDVPADATLPIHVTDTMTNGLDYQASTMMIKVGTGDPAATNDNVTAVTRQTGDTFTWKYTIAANDNTRGKKVVFTFQATVNANAIVDTGKKNDVDLQYGNTSYHKTDRVNYEIFATGAVKYDGATGTVNGSTNALEAVSGKTLKYLDGAHFKLQVQAGKAGSWADLPVAYNSTNNYYYPTTGTGVDIVTPENGEVYIRGLDDDNNYRLVETQAPEGYNLLNPTNTNNMTLCPDTYTGETTPTLSTVTELAKLKIANLQGSVLPSTGGIGTTIFYIVGGLLVIGAAVVLVARRKAHD